jgi:hypothetical protein
MPDLGIAEFPGKFSFEVLMNTGLSPGIPEELRNKP